MISFVDVVNLSTGNCFKWKNPSSGNVLKLHTYVNPLILVRLCLTFFVELINVQLEKNLKSVSTCFNIVHIALILVHMRFSVVKMIFLSCSFSILCSFKNKLLILNLVP